MTFENSQRRRLCFRNERKLYSRICNATGEKIISVYSQDKPYKVYKTDFWYGDKWNPLDYGRDFDFNRTFFEQFAELQLQVPRMALSNINCVNSDYCNTSYGNKNCYLIFGGDLNQDSMYGTLCMQNKTCLDLDFSNNNELCYELGDSVNCYSCSFALDSKNCSDCHFISDCASCNECLLCANLHQKSYCIENKQYSREEYMAKKKELLIGSRENQKILYEKFMQMRATRIVKNMHLLSCENCIGDYMKNSKNCINCFDISDSEDLRDVIFASKSRNCENCSMLGGGSELCFNALSSFGAYNCRQSFWMIDSNNIEYSEYSLNSHDLFGCIGMKHDEFCIFNKKYSKEEYKNLKRKIIEHMHKTDEYEKFFPSNLSCYGYNETTAQDYYPISKEQALQEGYKWKEENSAKPLAQTVIVPDNIKDVPESIINGILTCESCGRNFKILNQELDFYKKLSTPIPSICQDCRHTRRMSQRNPKKFMQRNCMKCGVEMFTTYAPSRPETVYCEKCYLESIY